MSDSADRTYRLLERSVTIHAPLTERQHRHVHALLGEPPGRHKTWAERYVFDLTLDTATADSVLEYLREQRLAHTMAAERRWDPWD